MDGKQAVHVSRESSQVVVIAKSSVMEKSRDQRVLSNVLRKEDSREHISALERRLVGGMEHAGEVMPFTRHTYHALSSIVRSSCTRVFDGRQCH